jgi:hypothetical protein
MMFSPTMGRNILFEEKIMVGTIYEENESEIQYN